jgi:catechol 2,3-dioxygenase-like lactoylglutathione lyase family enzyme
MATAHGPETGHVGLNVSDLERSTRFYQAVFGAPMTTHGPACGFF